MRRFSQRPSLVTLGEINITPLLDIAFVLLIIFIITTPLLEQGMDLKLPRGGEPDRPLNREDVAVVEIGPHGRIQVNYEAATLAEVARLVGKSLAVNPRTVVWIRADRATPWAYVAAVLDRLKAADIHSISVRTEIPETP